MDSGTELQEQLAAFRREFLTQVPAEVAATMGKATEDLVRSGIAERSLRVGEGAPDFALPNVRGEIVRLSALLARGPVVVTLV